jgi:glutamine amidotransferase
MPGTYVLNCGNRRSVIKALEHLGEPICPELGEAARCIIPGVGTMASVMQAIGGIRAELEWFRKQGRPILGICAGMHAMCLHSEEGDCEGLGWWPYFVKKLPPPIPRQGWHAVTHGCMYFSHSYAVIHDTWDSEIYAQERGNLHGCQFHPEKSQRDGLAFLQRFLSWTP